MNQNYPVFQNNMVGTMYPQQMPQAKMTQGLTQEEIKELKTSGKGFNLNIDPIDVMRSRCTHKDNGQFTVIDNGDGTSTCSICGATFELIEEDPEVIREYTRKFISILQSIKTYYLDIPEEYVNQVFRVIPLLEKVPTLYKYALTNFNNYNRTVSPNMSGYGGGFGMLGGIAGFGFGQMGFAQQPQMGYPQQPQMGYPQQPQMGYPQQPQMGYQQPQQGFCNTNAFGGYPQQQPQMQYAQPQYQQPQYQQPQQGGYPQQQQPQYQPPGQDKVVTTKTMSV